MGVDISVHESFAPPATLIERQYYNPEFALWPSTPAHASPSQFAEIMRLAKPRVAVAYHFSNDFDTLPEQLRQIRDIYDGPLVMALDTLVINVTPEDVRVRRAVIDQEAWPMPPNRPIEPAPAPGMQLLSDFTMSGGVFMTDVLRALRDDVNAEFNADVRFPER